DVLHLVVFVKPAPSFTRGPHSTFLPYNMRNIRGPAYFSRVDYVINGKKPTTKKTVKVTVRIRFVPAFAPTGGDGILTHPSPFFEAVNRGGLSLISDASPPRSSDEPAPPPGSGAHKTWPTPHTAPDSTNLRPSTVAKAAPRPPNDLLLSEFGKRPDTPAGEYARGFFDRKEAPRTGQKPL